MPPTDWEPWSFGWLPLPPRSGKSHNTSLEANMSEQKRESGEAPGTSEPGSQQSRFVPETHIDAEHIAATNVVSGAQYNTYNYQQTQKYVPSLQLPRRAEHFADRASERAWLLAHLRPGQIV